MSSPLLRVVGVKHLQPTHLTQVTMEIRAAVAIETVSSGGVRTELIGSAHRVRLCREKVR